MSVNAQTREHAVLLKASGVGHVVVVVNKMDSTEAPFCRDRFAHIVADLSRYLLDELHFMPSQLRFLPASAFTGENLCVISKSCPMAGWWKPGYSVEGVGAAAVVGGQTLVQTLEGLAVPHFSSYYEPLRALTVTPPTNLSTHGSAGAGAANTVEVYVRVCRGQLRVGGSVGVATASKSSEGGLLRCTVKKIVLLRQDGSSGGGAGLIRVDCKTAFAGQFALAYLQATGLSATPGGSVDPATATAAASKSAFQEMLAQAVQPAGTVIAKGPNPDSCRPRTSFRCMVRTLPQLSSPLIPGSSFSLHAHGYAREVTCVLYRLCSIVAPGAPAVVAPKCVPPGQLAVVELTTSEPMVLEPLSAPHYYHGNSRFVLRHKGLTVATGVCEKHVS
jgi:translation elongation factor EF-1alpha